MLFTGTVQLLAVRERTGALLFAQGLPLDRPSPGTPRLAVGAKTVYLLDGVQLLAADRTKWFQTHTTVSARLQGVRMEQQHLARRLRGRKDAQGRLKFKALEARRRLLSRVQRERLEDCTRWQVKCECKDAIAACQGMVFVGGRDVVKGFDSAKGKEVWSARVAGRARR